MPTPVPIPPNGVDYRGKLVLAPMVRSGELPSRLTALSYGADLVWGPETVDRALIGTVRRINTRTGMVEYTRLPSNQTHTHDPNQGIENVIYRLDPVREKHKLIFQLGTSDAERAVAAARIVAGDVAGIDVNAGCPKPFSTSGGMGAALLKAPEKLAGILEALVGAIVPEHGVGISVKIRLLETAEETELLVRRLVRTGITGLTIHCRTTPMRPRERAIRGQLRMVAEVCREAGVACVMNGDVESREQAERLIEEFGVDGAMIATAAEKNPSCFARGPLRSWREVVERYVVFAMEVGNKMGNTKFMLNQMVPGREQVFKMVAGCKGYEDLVTALGMGEEAIAKAKEADAADGFALAKRAREEAKKEAARVKAEERAREREASLKRKRDESQGASPNKKLADQVTEIKPAPVANAA
ncbi:hypothetical protein OQA88_3705 [Cercophora sp. LCS_1]